MNQQNKGLLNDMDKLVAKRMKIARLLRGLSQQQLGKALGISIQQIQKYEKATNRISSGKLYYLAEFLKLPITYFFDKNENNIELISIADITEKEILTLINSFNSIKDAKLKKYLIGMTKLISEY